MAIKKTAKAAPKKRAQSISNSAKKDLAKLLFTRNNLNQKEVAQRVGVNEKTIGKWVKDDRWEDMRKSLLVTREEQLRNMMDQLSELNAAIKKRPEGERYANSKEGDTQMKITAAIKKLSTDAGLNEIIEVASKIISFIMSNFPEHLKLTTSLLDAFVKTHL